MSKEELLKIAKELQKIANYWELVQNKLEYFQRNIQSLNLNIPKSNIALVEFLEKKYGEEVKRGLIKIVQKVYKFNNYIDKVAA